MIRLTVSRNDNVYECFPDIARAADGTLVCVYRESMMHAAYPFSRLVVRRSPDGGRNWMDRQILIDCVQTTQWVDASRDWLEADALAGYEESRTRITEDWQVGANMNCSRLTCLADGTLFLIADIRQDRWHSYIWRSTDNGATWNGPDRTDMPAGLVPSVLQLRNGDVMVGLASPDGRPFFCRSADGGRTWSNPVYMPQTSQREIDEVSFVELDDGTIVGFGRNLVLERASRPSCGLTVISRDGGSTWAGPFDTWLMGLEGRPKAGLLSSGEVCVTYRCDMPNEMLAMHVMTQAAARFEKPGETVERMPEVEDIPAALAEERCEDRPWYMSRYYPGRTTILDIDRSVHRDGGYSGWVQLENSDIFVVDYINDDAPLAHIRGYIVSRSDYILFPDGDLPWLHPSFQPFRNITYAMARRQLRANKGQDTP